jgi:hypothetical protein
MCQRRQIRVSEIHRIIISQEEPNSAMFRLFRQYLAIVDGPSLSQIMLRYGNALRRPWRITQYEGISAWSSPTWLRSAFQRGTMDVVLYRIVRWLAIAALVVWAVYATYYALMFS